MSATFTSHTRKKKRGFIGTALLAAARTRAIREKAV